MPVWEIQTRDSVGCDNQGTQRADSEKAAVLQRKPIAQNLVFLQSMYHFKHSYITPIKMLAKTSKPDNTGSAGERLFRNSGPSCRAKWCCCTQPYCAAGWHYHGPCLQHGGDGGAPQPGNAGQQALCDSCSDTSERSEEGREDL